MDARKLEQDGTRTVLVVEDDETIARSIAAAMKPSLEPVVVGDLSNARAELERQSASLAAAVVDLMLPDGSGLDLIDQLRRDRAILPVLILTGQAEPNLINRAHALHAEYVCKPHFHDNLKDFLRRVVQPSADTEQHMLESSRVFAANHSLSVRETEILGLASTGVPRGRIADVLGVSENTIKTQIRSILDKTSQNSLSDVVWMVRQPDPPSG